MPKKKLTIVLVTAPARDGVCSDLPQLHSGGDIGIKPPLGILHIASHVVAHSAHRVQVIDSAVGDLGYETLVERILECEPDVVGVTAWTDYWYATCKTLQMIKNHSPEIFTVVGGPHTLVYPGETLNHEAVDAIVVGDGETPFLSLVESLSRGVRENNIPGLHLKCFGLHKHLIHEEADLDAVAHPDRALLPVSEYFSVVGKGGLVTTMITSRGCPFACVYCKLLRQTPRMHSARYVLEEFDRIHALGIGEVEIYDDTFTWSHRRVEEICRGLLERNYRIRWAIRDRVSNVRPETLALMKKAGCVRIHYGIESGCDEVLTRIQKKITVAEAAESVRLAKRIGFEVLTFFMFGLPGETMLEARKTLEFSLSLPADYSLYSITTAYPGTEMYNSALSDGRIGHDYWRAFAISPRPDFLPPSSSVGDLSSAELLQLRDEATRRFYFRPRTLLNELRKIASWREFSRKARMGLVLLKDLIKNRLRENDRL